MKKNPTSYSRMVAAIVMITTIAGSALWLTPTLAVAAKGGKAASVAKTAPINPEKVVAPPADRTRTAAIAEENALITRLIDDHLVASEAGFTIEKNGVLLYINGMLQPGDIAARYLSDIRQGDFIVEVYPLHQWLKENPAAMIAPYVFPATARKKFRPGRDIGC